MQKPVFIYTLSCPTSGQVRYVGKATNPKRRFRAHLTKASKERNYKANWIKSLLSQGLSPQLEIIAKVPENAWQFWERSYLHCYRSLGFDLVNGTEGGEGFESGDKHPKLNKGIVTPANTRKKISEALTGIKRSPEFCEKLGASRRGKKHPFFGKTLSPEHRAKIARPGALNHRFGKTMSAEQKAKISATKTGNSFHTPEMSVNQSAAQRGKKMTRNTSGFVGVSWCKEKKKWKAFVSVDYRSIQLGRFSKIEDAVFVRALAVDKHYGNK